MNQEIKDFISQQTCAGICCVDENGHPYCFTAFIAFNATDGLLYFKSSPATHHSAILILNPQVAGTILPNKINKLNTQGVQFAGVLLQAENKLTQNAASHYYKKHPLAVAVSGEIHTIQLNQIKYSGLRVGLKTKLLWKREEKASENK